jgi:DNA polymerase-1
VYRCRVGSDARQRYTFAGVAVQTYYIDTETHLIAPGRLAPQLVCVQVAQDDAPPAIVLASDRDLPALLRRVLAHRVVGHNIAFDLAVLCNRFPELWSHVWRAYDEDRVGDTLYAAQLLDVALGKLGNKYSLKDIAKRFASMDLEKGEDTYRLRYAELERTPIHAWPKDAVQYALLDVEATRKVWLELSEGNVRQIPTLSHQCRAYWALHLASCWGMRCDPAAVQALRQEIEQGQAKHYDKLVTAGVLRANGTRDDNVVRERAKAAGVTRKTAGGKVSVNAEALREVKDEVLQSLLVYQGWGKLHSTYLPVVERGTREPIQARYTLVESGRTGCRNPNIQNLPRNGHVRECFAARPGFVYVAADYHVAELVCLAQVLLKWVSPSSEMANALLTGKDLHVVTAANILKCSYEYAMQAIENGDPKATEARQLAKANNFGIPGGLGANRLARLIRNYGLDVTEREAADLRQKWLKLYPEMETYFQQIGTATIGDDWRCHHPLTGYIRGGLSYCDGANHLFQHLAAYGGKSACYAVQRACFQPSGKLAGCRLVAFVHDELIIEAPEDKCHEAADELVAIMEREFAKACPDVPVHAEAVAMRQWAKKAKPVYRDGRLVPWEP